MKKVALFMMIVGLAVVFTACQGAVGQAGDDGAAGDDGTAGTPGVPGPQGPPGFSALIAKEDVAPLWVNDAPRALGKNPIGTALIGPNGASVTLPATIDPADFFFGGTDMVTYTMIPWNHDEIWPTADITDGNAANTDDVKFDPMGVFTVTETADGMLTIAARASGARMSCEEASLENDPCGNADNHHYGRGTQFRLRAKDGATNIIRDTEPISIVRNGRPNTNGDRVEAAGPVTVGEQSGFPEGASTDQELNPCNAINVVCVDVVRWDRLDDNIEENELNWFDDWVGHNYLMYTPTPTMASEDYVSAAMGYNHDDSNLENRPAYLLMATGLKAGVDTSGNPALKKTDVVVIATDGGGLSTEQGEEAVWVVNVDPAPYRKPGVTPQTREVISSMDDTDSGTNVLDDVSRFFNDNVPDSLVFSAKITTNAAGAIAAPTDTGLDDLLDDDDNLMVSGLSPGTADITITASEPVADETQNPNDATTPRLGQTATLVVTVTVK
jgi:hypothetical protein